MLHRIEKGEMGIVALGNFILLVICYIHPFISGMTRTVRIVENKNLGVYIGCTLLNLLLKK